MKATIRIILIILLTSTCIRQTSPTELHCILDTSGSIPSHLREAMYQKVRLIITAWIDHATPGSSVTIWWLAPVKDPYPASSWQFTMPVLRVPAYVSRDEVRESVLDTVDSVLTNLPTRVQETHLLETMYMVGSLQGAHWNLVVLSDLEPDSPQWTQLKSHGWAFAMNEICPAVAFPPSAVTVFCWPGLTTNSTTDIHAHHTWRAQFSEFFATWADKDAPISITSLAKAGGSS